MTVVGMRVDCWAAGLLTRCCCSGSASIGIWFAGLESCFSSICRPQTSRNAAGETFADSVRIGLENLGFEAENLTVFNRIIRRPSVWKN